MINDPIAALAGSLEALCADLADLLRGTAGKPAAGSPAAKECEDEQFAGEWGPSPAMSAVGTMVLCANSCRDHLGALAALIRSRGAVMSLHTVARGTAEAAAVGSYVTEPGIDQRERARRTLNLRLAGLHRERQLLRKFADPETAARIAELDATVDRYGRSAAVHGFAFTEAKGSSAARLGDVLPSTTALLGMFTFPGEDSSAPPTTARSAAWRTLSSTGCCACSPRATSV